LVAPSLVNGIDPWQDLRLVIAVDRATTVFDVGAHWGESLEELAPIFPAATIHCFEPFPASFERLRRQAVSHPRTELNQCAVGAVDGEVTLHVNRGTDFNSALAPAPELEQLAVQLGGDATPVEEVTVPLLSLDSYCAQRAVQRVDFLKIDTQGFDLEVLKGCEEMLSDKRVGAIFCEVLFTPHYEQQPYFEDITAFLRGRDYRLVDLYTGARADNRSLIFGNALFV
jgi:FkbM family methyltransferase